MLERFRERYLLELVVFVSGSLVMIYEIIGSRILAPYIGTSTYIWTSLIGVILGSLSLGYWFGGKMADKQPNLRVLSSVMFIGGAILSVTIIIQNIILSLVASFPIRLELKAVIAACILFAPASVLFGFVTPYAIRLKMQSVENAGKTVGRLYALSTVGSIFGTFLAGFILLPFLGSSRTMYILAGLMFGLALLLAPFGKQIISIFLLLLLPTSIIFNELYLFNPFSSDKTIDFDTQYNRVRIMDRTEKASKKKLRMMVTDHESAQSAMYLEDEELVIDYTKFYHLLRHFNPNFQKTLIIGGAAYSFPKDYLRLYPNKQIDVVEIDPQMTETARKYFKLEDNPNLKIFHADGRVFLNQNTQKYDVILIDAFTSLYSVPFQLTTVEAVREMDKSLSENGVIIVNLITAFEGEGAKFLEAGIKTYAEVFPNIFLFKPVDDKSASLPQNVILVATKSKDTKFESTDSVISNFLSKRYPQLPDLTVPVLTDDLAPVEYYNSLAYDSSKK
jgi:spermidine synthase